MIFEDVRRIALTFPAVMEGTSYGTPSFKVKGKFMLRLREDEETIAAKVGFDERDMLIQSDPGTFFITDHYQGYPAVLVRLAVVSEEDLQEVVELSWRFSAPKKLVEAWEADGGLNSDLAN